MNDKELLELAAKAAGLVDLTWLESLNRFQIPHVESGSEHDTDGYLWNPLADDGDALRLAVKLQMVVNAGKPSTDETRPLFINDPYAATRRAIVKAAAHLGKVGTL